MIAGEVIWVTGASSGIGRELVMQLARAGNQVIASGRNQQALAELSHQYPNIIPLAFDVCDAAAAQAAAASIAEKFTGIDRVVVNAGVCEYFDVAQPDWDMMRRVMDVNYFGAINCIAASLPILKSTGKQHLVVVASLASLVPFPRAEAYGASKAALNYFCNALRVDLASQQIAVTVVQPGFVATPLTAKNDFAMPFLLTPEVACARIIRQLVRKPANIWLPRRLAWLLAAFSYVPRVWHWLAVNQLARTRSTTESQVKTS